jgi:hypothetical protein
LEKKELKELRNNGEVVKQNDTLQLSYFF